MIWVFAVALVAIGMVGYMLFLAPTRVVTMGEASSGAVAPAPQTALQYYARYGVWPSQGAALSTAPVQSSNVVSMTL